MKIYIPKEKKINVKKKELFVLVRPFFKKNKWNQYGDDFYSWNLNPKKIQLVYDINLADIMLIPMPINYYYENDYMQLISKYNSYTSRYKIIVFGFISGDFGFDFSQYKNIKFFRLNGFKSRFSENNYGFPAVLSDQYKILFKKQDIQVCKKPIKPVISFCGHATNSKLVYLNQTFNFYRENIKRFIRKPLRNDYEVVFQSAYYRYKILKQLKKNNSLKTNFIFREKYRGGAKNSSSRTKTTIEYYNNMINSNYVFCLRGSGNFSIRFYEALMMGKIPIFINTDCFLPFSNIINWKDHVIWVDWLDIDDISNIILEFHENISDSDFENLQLRNRNLWLDKLNPSWTLKNLMNI